jgi:hypothetical protein
MLMAAEAGLADPANAVAAAPSLPPRRHGAEAPDRDAMIATVLAYVGELNTRYPLIRTRNSTYTFFAKDTAFANSLGVQQQRRRIWHYLRSHWLANSVFPGLAEIHGCLRDGLEPVRQQPWPDPLALRGHLGSRFARSIGDTC